MRSGSRGSSARFGFADLEPGHGLGGGTGNFAEQLVADLDAEGAVGRFDGDGTAGVDHADVDALPSNDYRFWRGSCGASACSAGCPIGTLLDLPASPTLLSSRSLRASLQH